MALDDIDKLSDEETVAPSPSAGVKEAAKQASKAEAKAKAKVAPKAKGKPSSQPTEEVPKVEKEPAAPKTKGKGAKPAPKPRPKTSTATPKRKRDASAGASRPAMKRPAACTGRDDKKESDPIRVCKSLYKRDGVWSIKLAQKEVIRVLGLRMMGSVCICV